MKNYWTLILLVLALGSLTGCGEKQHNVQLDRANGRDPVKSGGTNVGPGPSSPGSVPSANLELNGRIFATLDPAYYNSDPYLQQDFMDAIKGLISATDNPEAYGYVAGAPHSTEPSGIYLGAALHINGTEIDNSKSYMQIEIRDQYAGQKASNGKVIPGYPVRMKLDDYYYNPQSSSDYELQLIFKDNYGVIKFYGSMNFKAGYVQGYVEYQNYTSFDGGPLESGVLGDFTIATCDLFVGLSGCN